MKYRLYIEQKDAGAGGMRTGGMKDKRDEVQDIYRTGGCRAGGIHKNRREKGQEG